MAITTDTLVTEFRMVGAPQLLKALNAITAAYEKMAKAQAKVASIPLPKVPPGAGGSGGGGGTGNKWTAFFAGMLGGGRLGGGGITAMTAGLVGGTAALEGFAASAAAALGPVVAIGTAILGIGAAVNKAEGSLVEYGTAIMNLRDLSGESAQDAAKANAVFQIAGISATQEMRDLLKLGKDVRSQAGETGLGLLGVHINQADSPIQVAMKLGKALNDLPGGMQKVEAAAQAAGIRVTGGLLALGRLTDAQKAAAESNAFQVNDEDLKKIQDLGVQYTLLGQVFMSQVVLPIATEFMPIVKETILFLEQLARGFAYAEKYAHFLEITMGGIAAAFVVLNPEISAIMAAVAGVTWLLGGMNDNAAEAKTGTGDLKGSMGNLQSSVDANTGAMQTTNMHLAKLASDKGIPQGLTIWDLNTLSSQNMLANLG